MGGGAESFSFLGNRGALSRKIMGPRHENILEGDDTIAFPQRLGESLEISAGGASSHGGGKG